MHIKPNSLFCCLLLATVLGFAGCGTGTNPPGDLNFPDLVVAENPSSPGSYYDIDNSTGEVMVWVHNQGSLTAPPSYVRLTFRNSGGILGSIEIPTPTPAIPPGATVGPFRGAVVNPGGCYQPDCATTIEVDTRDDVDESREDNNTRDVSLLG